MHEMNFKAPIECNIKVQRRNQFLIELPREWDGKIAVKENEQSWMVVESFPLMQAVSMKRFISIFQAIGEITVFRALMIWLIY